MEFTIDSDLNIEDSNEYVQREQHETEILMLGSTGSNSKTSSHSSTPSISWTTP